MYPIYGCNLRETDMNKNKIIVLSVSVIVLTGFAFSQLKQPEQLPQANETVQPMAPVSRPMPQAIQQNKQLNSMLNTHPQSNDTEILVKQTIETSPQYFPLKSTVKTRKYVQPSDHQGQYTQARPHGHEQHSSHEHNSSLPLGEPKNPTARQPPPLN